MSERESTARTTIRRSRTESFEHTINGLLTKRADLFNEGETIRDRLAQLRADIEAVDRVLGALGYEGELDAAMPRAKRNVMFGRGELTRAILEVLRDAEGPMTSRDITRLVVADTGDRKAFSEAVKRVSKALRALAQDGAVGRQKARTGESVWQRLVLD